jgi:hypothetical protein
MTGGFPPTSCVKDMESSGSERASSILNQQEDRNTLNSGVFSRKKAILQQFLQISLQFDGLFHHRHKCVLCYLR